MFIEQAIINFLKNNKKIKNEIGERIYSDSASYDGQKPFIVFYYNEEPVKNIAYFKNGSFSFYIFAKEKITARMIEKLLSKQLNNFTGIISKIHVKKISYNGFISNKDNKINMYFFISNYKIIYKESQ